MRRFFALASVSMQASLQYRFAFLLNLVTPFVLLIGQYLLWGALYAAQGGGQIGIYTQKSMFTYILLAFLINNLLTWKSENDLSRKIISGSIVADCVRPMPFLFQNIADMCGSTILQAGANITFVLIAFAVFGDRLMTAPPTYMLLSFLSLILALLLRMLLVSTFSLLCFYTTSFLGLSWTRGVLTEFFSGAVVPVALFPPLLQTITYFTPFPLMLQVPLSIFLRQDMHFSIGTAFLLQIIWILVFVGLQMLCWGNIRKNIQVAGG